MKITSDCETPRRPIMRGINHQAKQAVFFSPRCKLWSCPYCAELNKGLWAVRGFQGAERLCASGDEIDFLTLTSHERLSAEQSRLVFRHAWDQLNKRARRAAPDYQYVLIPEQHQNGRLHCHAIETSGLGSRWWKDNARSCGLGFMAEEDPVFSPAGAAFYIVKYVTKSLEYQHWPKGFRRIRASRGWPKLDKLDQPTGWTWVVLPKDDRLDYAVSRLEILGYDVQLLGSGEAWRYIRGEENID